MNEHFIDYRQFLGTKFSCDYQDPLYGRPGDLDGISDRLQIQLLTNKLLVIKEGENKN